MFWGGGAKAELKRLETEGGPDPALGTRQVTPAMAAGDGSAAGVDELLALTFVPLSTKGKGRGEGKTSIRARRSGRLGQNLGAADQAYHAPTVDQ